MKFFKFLISIGLTLASIYFLSIRLHVGQSTLPPLGKFLNPFQGFWQNAKPGSIDEPEEFSIPGLSEKVTIKYDTNLIPHIFAQNNQDLYTAAGYVAASQRLWQIELVTHHAAGRLSEIIGNKTVNMDREQRRIGMTWSARKVLEEWKKYPEIYNSLEAYSNGVNHYIHSLEYKDLPIEYKLLDYEPENWTPYKTALVLKYMSKLLTISESDIENTNFLKIYGLDTLNEIFPDFAEGVDPVIPPGTKWDFKNEIKPIEPDTLFTVPLISNVYEKPFKGLGSNNWAVGKSKTTDGTAIFANDMHLTLNLPSIWFVVQYHTPEFNAYGHILPGTPYIIQGFNDSIAWGMTNAYRDLVDWYLEKFKDENRDEYLYDGNWLLANKVIDTIKVRDDEDIIDTIVYTHHGPVVYDRNFQANSQKVNLAMRWIAHEPSLELLCLDKLVKSHNYDDFKEAIKYFSCPPQNFAFADRKGNVAMIVQGKFPNKYYDQGKFILDGTTSKTEWQGFIPLDENPQIFNPDRGFVSSANQHPVDKSYPYWVYTNNNEYYRNRRINNFLNQTDSINYKDLMQLQNDTYSIFAEETLPLLLDSLKRDKISEKDLTVARELGNWDYKYEPLAKAPAYFEMWTKELYLIIWDEIFDSDVPLPHPSSYQTVWLMKNEPDFEFFDIKNTPEKETLNNLINISYQKCLQDIKQWRADNPGKELNRSSYFHTSIMHYAQIPQFSAMDLEVGGCGDVVNAITNTHGPSERIVVKMGDSIQAWHTYPGGQSGNPGNPQYEHFLQSWIKGTYFPVYYFKNQDDYPDQTIFSQTITP